MKTISATLLSAQRQPHGRGVVAATLADGPMLHATVVATTTPTGANTVACSCGAFYVRIRMTAGASDKLDVQKISDPTVASQWTTWTNLVANNVVHPRGIAIFWTGTYCVICWQDLASGDVKFKRSTDGAAWSATAVAYATTVQTKVLSGCSAGAATSGIALTYGSQLYWGQYNDAANTWTAVSSAGASISSATPDVAVFADSANSRYIFAVATAGFKTWTTFALALFTRSFAGAWDSGRVLFAQSSTGFTGLSFAQNQVRGRWWLSFYKITLWNTTAYTSQLVCASDDGLYWSDPLPTSLAGNERTLDILSAASGWSSAYFSTERAAYRLDTYDYWSATVARYEWAAAIAGSQRSPAVQAGAAGGGDEPRPQLTVVLDNRDGTLTAPRLFSELTLSRGYVTGGGTYTHSAGRWYVASFRYLQNDQVLELHCFDARGLLASWFAAEAANYRLDSVATLVERICALAGVHTVSFDSFAAWGDVISAFTHPVGENALYSLRSLAQRVPFEYLVREDGSLYFYVPTAAPASVYTYGSGAAEHPFWPAAGGAEGFGAAPAINYLQVVGAPPRSRVTLAKDAAALDTQGRRRSLIVNDRRITTDANGTELSDALLVALGESQRAGSFTSPPAFNVEPGDVIDFNNGLYADTAGPWRVERIVESFNMGGAHPFRQRVVLRGTA